MTHQAQHSPVERAVSPPEAARLATLHCIGHRHGIGRWSAAHTCTVDPLPIHVTRHNLRLPGCQTTQLPGHSS
jgi:hypothetical protein